MVGSGGSSPRGGGERRETPKKIDRYEIRRVLGRGAQGIVYHGYDPNFDIEVAIKVFQRDDFSERNRIEAQTAVRLVHRNIVRVLDFKPEYPYLVMEYCGDGDLERYIKSCRRRSVAEILAIVRQVCEALVASHEHERPILHRDLKPSNVLFQKGVPKVADFGLAKIVGGASETSTHDMMGTAFYCSPEQFRDASRVDRRADLWSVGVILYEMATWTLPFGTPQDNRIEVGIKVRTEPPNDPPYEMPPPLRALTFKMLQKNPDHRFNSAREIIAELDQVLKDLPEPERLLLPPEHVVNDRHRLAARIAELMGSDRVEEASSAIQQLTTADPDSLLSTFWDRCLRQLRDDSLSSVPDPDHPISPPSPGRLESIQSHIASRSYGRARDDILKWLQDEPGNTMATWLLEKVNDDERRFRDDLRLAREKADAARAAGDLPSVCDVWKSFLEKYPEFPEAQAEQGFATRELGVLEQRGLREEAVREARRLRDAHDHRAAAAAWRAYVERYPQDREAVREMQSHLAEASRWEREVRIAGLRAAARKLQAEGDLVGALKAWDEVLREDPSAAEAVEAERQIRAEIVAQERVRQFDASTARAESLRRAGELPGAIRVFEQFLLAYPWDPEATPRVEDLRRELAEIERRALREDVERLAATLESRLGAGRYDGIPPARERVAVDIRSARAALAGDGAALDAHRARLRGARAQAEASLTAEAAARRAKLLDGLRESRLRLGETATVERQELPSEQELDRATRQAVQVLCLGYPAESAGDPVARLAQATDTLSTAVHAVDRDRRQAVADAREHARRTLSEARVAIESFVAESPSGGTKAEGNPADLEDRLRRLLQESDSPTVERLQQLQIQADALRQEADAARTATLARLGERARKLVDQGAELVGRGRGERLETLLRQVAVVLEPTEREPAAAPSALGKACAGLSAELASAKRALDDSLARVRERWTAVAAAARQGEHGEAVAELVARGDALLRSGRPEDVEPLATELDARLREEHLQSMWAAQADVVAEIEGALDQAGLPVDELDPEQEHLLRRYREAAFRGNDHEMTSVLAALEKDRPAETRRGGEKRRTRSVRVVDLGRRKRAVNVRLNPGALAQYAEITSQLRDRTRQAPTARLEADLTRAERRLLEPAPLWKRWVPAAVTVVVAGAVWLGTGSKAHAVRVMGLGGEVEVSSVRCNGRAVSGLASRLPGGPETVEWRLPAGHCEATTAEGGRRPFDVPADGVVFLPAGNADYRQALLEWIDLGREDTTER